MPDCHMPGTACLPIAHVRPARGFASHFRSHGFPCHDGCGMGSSYTQFQEKKVPALFFLHHCLIATRTICYPSSYLFMLLVKTVS